MAAAILASQNLHGQSLPPELRTVSRTCSSSVALILAEKIIRPPGQREKRVMEKGTGFFVHPQGTVLTASHVVEDASRVTANPEGQNPRECLLVDSKPNYDIAALRVADAEGNLPQPLPLASVNSAPEPFDPVVLISYPAEAGLTCRGGQFDGIENTSGLKDQDGSRLFPADFGVFKTSIVTAKGSSGGPVFNTKGEVVGILTAGHGGGAHALTYCVPAGIVQSKLSLSQAGRRFSGSLASSERLSNARLSYSTASRTKVGGGLFASKPARDLRSMSWGAINPSFLGAVFDDQCTAMMAIGNWLPEIAMRNLFIRVVNPNFGFSVVVPHHFSLRETASGDSELLSTFTDGTGMHELSIKSRFLTHDEMAGKAAAELFDDLASDYVRNDLEIEFLTDHPANVQNDRQAVIDANYSDIQPRSNAFGQQWRFWRHYVQPDGRGNWTHHITIYALSGNVFCVVHFAYPHQIIPVPMTPPEVVERLFVAASFSFMQ